MATPLGPSRDQPGRLQRGLDPLITHRQAVLLAQLVTEVRDAEALVLLLVQSQDPPHRSQRHPLRTRSVPPSIQQPIVAALLVARLPAAHRAATHAQNLGGLPPLQLSTDRFENHFLYFHRPLHGGYWIALHSPPLG